MHITKTARLPDRLPEHLKLPVSTRLNSSLELQLCAQPSVPFRQGHVGLAAASFSRAAQAPPPAGSADAQRSADSQGSWLSERPISSLARSGARGWRGVAES